MTVQDLLPILTQGFFVLLGFLTFLDYLRQREALKRDVALAFNSIAVNTSISLLNHLVPVDPFIRLLGTMFILAQPYLFLRLTHYLQPVPKRIQQLTLAGLISVWGLRLVFTDVANSQIPPITLIMIAYFVLINGYVMLRFLQGVRKTSGLLHQRLLLCAVGTGLFASALLLLVPLIFQPNLQSILIIPVGLAAIFSALAFLFGFVPPRWLQKIWQFNELRNFLLHLNQESAAAWLSTPKILTELAVVAERITGGMGAIILARQAVHSTWELSYRSETLGPADELIDLSKRVEPIWQNGSTTYLSMNSRPSQLILNLLDIAHAKAMLIVPIQNPEHVLLVFLAHPLFFPEEDSELLSILAQQAGTILENIDLVEQLQEYSGKLEQKIVERTAALEQSEERFRSIFEQAAVGIAEVSLDGHFLQLNQRFCDIVGYSQDELRHLSFQEITHSEDLAADLSNRSLLRAGTISKYAMQKRYYHKTGRPVWVNLSVSMVHSSSRGDYFIAVIEDISERKLAAIAQRQAELRFARVLDTTAEAVITIDSSQKIILFNQSAEKIFGYTPQEALGQKLEILLPPEIIARHHRYLSNFSEGSDIARGMGNRNKELFARHKDGNIFPIEASISKLTEDDEIILTVFIRDISEQQKAAQALKESEGRYHHIIDNMLESFQIISFDWRYLYVNEAAARHGRVSREELLGHTLMEKYPGIETTEMFAALRHTMEARVTQHIEFKFIYPDMTTAWFEFSIQPIPEGIFILSLNITERKEAEVAMQRLNEELEERVSERTAHLEAVNKELEAFSYSVSHDLRAPLRALDGFSQALLEDYNERLDEDGREYLGLIRYESQRMGQLIDDLIGLSRLSRRDLQRQTVNLSNLAQEIAQELAKQDPQRNGRFIIAENLLVCADPNLLRIALQNLLANAWKYSSKQRDALIELGCQEGQDEVVYFVRDNGVGFDIAYVHKLFGAFQRLHGMTEFEGTGIGLATVQRIIHRHGGSIRAEGTVNQGASFYFTLGKESCNEGEVR
jgi:PAS domain S-box-containing protein